ncbi:MAG: helix-turn-helix domain-containing protein [Clostridia bacterium]|nr:helix-turn-helix domain-containing protein [Clostridia bacterium]
MDHIGQKIKTLRKTANLTQEGLAELLGVSSQAVSKWEVGSASPDLSLIAPLCRVFGCSADELLGIGRQESPGAGNRNSLPGLYIGRPDDGKTMVKASFEITADRLDFDAVRNKLSMEPVLCRKKEEFPLVSRQKGLAKDQCLFSTLYREMTELSDPEPLLNLLLDDLLGKENIINELKKEYQASTRFVVTFSTFRNPQIRFSGRLLDFLCATQTALDVDSYIYQLST